MLAAGMDVSGVMEEIVGIAAFFAAVAGLMHRKSPLRRVASWLWRRNVTEPATHLMRATIETTVRPIIAETVEPLIAATRAASVAQHDEQNVNMRAGFAGVREQFDVITSRLDGIDERLDRGSERIAQNSADISALKDQRPRNARTRATDKE